MWLLGGGKNDVPPATIHVGSEDLQDVSGTPQFPPVRVNRQDVFALHTRQQSLLEQINTLTAHLEGVNRNLALAEAKLLETDLELGALKESRNEVQRAIKTLTADSVKKIEERRQVCVREIGQLQKEFKENDSAITSLSDRLTALVSGNKEKEKAKLGLANQIATHRHAAQKLSASIRQHGTELTNLVTQRSDHNLDEFSVAQLDKSLQGVHRELALGTGQLRAELESVDMLNQQVADLNSRINSNSVKLHALRRTLPEMQLVSKQNLARTKELQDETAKLEKELEAALKRLKALETGLTDLEKKIVLKQQARVDATATFETLQKTQASTMMQFAELQTQQLAVATEVDKVIRQTLPTDTIAQAAQTCNARCVSIDKPVDGKLTATKVLMMFEETIPPNADPEQSFRLCVEVFEIVSCKMYRQKRPVDTPSNSASATPKATTPKAVADPAPKAPQTADAKDTTAKPATDLAAPEPSPKSGSKSPRSGGKRPPNAPSYLVIELKPGYHNLFAASKPSGRRLSLPGMRRGSWVDDAKSPAKDKRSPQRRSSVSDLPAPALSRSNSLSTTTSPTSTTPTTSSTPSAANQAPLMRRRSLGSVSSIDFEFPELSPTPTTSSSTATTATTSTSASTSSSLPPASVATTTAEVATPVTTTTVTPVTETSTDGASPAVSTTTPSPISTSTTSSTPTTAATDMTSSEVSSSTTLEGDPIASTTSVSTTTSGTTPTSSSADTATTTATSTTTDTAIEEATTDTTTSTTTSSTTPTAATSSTTTTDSNTSTATTASSSTSTTTTETTSPIIATNAATSSEASTATSTSSETSSTPTIVLPTSPTHQPPLESPDAGLPPIPAELETLKTQPPQEATTFSRLRGFFAAEDKKDTVRYVFKGERHQLTAICISFTQSLAELNKAELSQNHPPPKEKPTPRQAPPEDDDMPAIDWALIGAVQGGPDVAVNLSAGESEILTVPQLKRLTCLAPFRSCIGGSWNLVYSLTRDGVSLSSFYHAMEGVQSSIFVIRDEHKKVFGGFSNEEWRIHEGYYGSADCFVYEITQKTGLRTYRWTGGNTFFLHSTATTLAFGGGSHFALSLNSTLDRGISGPCETYGSPQLSSNHSFEIRLFEVWGILPDPDD